MWTNADIWLPQIVPQTPFCPKICPKKPITKEKTLGSWWLVCMLPALYIICDTATGWGTYIVIFLALLLLTVTTGSDLDTCLNAALNAMIVTGRHSFFTRFEWLWNKKISSGYLSRRWVIIDIALGGISTRSAFSLPRSRISIESLSMSSYRSANSLPALRLVWKINTHKSAQVSEMPASWLFIIKNCMNVNVFLLLTFKRALLYYSWGYYLRC